MHFSDEEPRKQTFAQAIRRIRYIVLQTEREHYFMRIIGRIGFVMKIVFFKIIIAQSTHGSSDAVTFLIEHFRVKLHPLMHKRCLLTFGNPLEHRLIQPNGITSDIIRLARSDMIGEIQFLLFDAHSGIY